MNHYDLRKEFIKFHADKRLGVILKLIFGDDNLVGELRKTNRRYIVSVYSYKRGRFIKLFQERYLTGMEAYNRINEIQEEF